MNDDLISRKALKEEFETLFYNDYDDYLRTERLIDNAPTIEERPKGKWLPVGKTVSGINHNFCPICKRDIISEFTNYCPNCGADMRGDV